MIHNNYNFFLPFLKEVKRVKRCANPTKWRSYIKNDEVCPLYKNTLSGFIMYEDFERKIHYGVANGFGGLKKVS